MSAFPTVGSPIPDTARHPLSDGRKAACRAIAEGAARLAPSVLRIFAGDIARMCLEAAALAAFLFAILFWSVALAGG